MTFKDASNIKSNQTGRSPPTAPRTSSTCPTCAPRSSRSPTRPRPRCATSVRSTSGALVAHGCRRPPGLRLRPPRRGRAHRGAVPRPGRRHQLLPDRRGGRLERQVAPGRPRGHGSAGRVLQARPAVRLPDEARALSARISEEIYFHALWASTRAGRGVRSARRLRRDPRRAGRSAVRPLGRHARPTPSRWAGLRERIAAHGLRNSLLIAIAPTATIASIAGCYECIEPQVSNLFKRETLSGEFLQINAYLVRELQARGPVDRAGHRGHQADRGLDRRTSTRSPTTCSAIYRTAWELPMRSLIDMARRPRRLHRPVPVAQPVHGVAHHRQALLDVPLRLEVGPQDDVLPAVPPGHPHQQDHRRDHRRRPRPTRRHPTTVGPATGRATPSTDDRRSPTSEAVACSLENPESCEACQ